MATENPRAIWQRMLTFDRSPLNCHSQCNATYSQMRCCLGQVQPAFRFTLVLVVTGNTVMAAQGSYRLVGPTVSLSRKQTIARKNTRNQFVGTDPREYSHSLDSLFGVLVSILTASKPRHTQFRVHTAFPVNYGDDFGSVIADIDHDLIDQCADYSPFELSIAGGMTPHGFEIPGEVVELLKGRHSNILPLLLPLNTQFDFLNLLQ